MSSFQKQIDRKWAERFLSLARVVASWSKDPSTQVGALVVKGKRILSLGFNGFPQKISDSSERLLRREEKRKIVLHAELNAILFAKRDLEDCALVVTHAPCPACTSVLIQSGIREVYFEKILPDWDWETSKALMEEAGVYWEQLGERGEDELG